MNEWRAFFFLHARDKTIFFFFVFNLANDFFFSAPDKEFIDSLCVQY